MAKRAQVTADEPSDKQKVSLTLDRTLIEEIRGRFDEEKLSTAVNSLLHGALAQARLAELVDELERESGPASQDAYDGILAQWFAEP